MSGQRNVWSRHWRNVWVATSSACPDAAILGRRRDGPTCATREAVDVHLADSLVALEVNPSAARRIVDIGTGAGFPGLALAVALPASEMRLVESQSKKCSFCGER